MRLFLLFVPSGRARQALRLLPVAALDSGDVKNSVIKVPETDGMYSLLCIFVHPWAWYIAHCNNVRLDDLSMSCCHAQTIIKLVFGFREQYANFYSATFKQWLGHLLRAYSEEKCYNLA